MLKTEHGYEKINGPKEITPLWIPAVLDKEGILQQKRYGYPWIACKFRRKDGSWAESWLAINEDSWVPVRPKKVATLRHYRPTQS